MKKRGDILRHVGYGLIHVDAFQWLCERIIEGIPRGPWAIVVDELVLISRPHFRFLQNPIAECGYVYCRKLLDFLGIKVGRNSPELCERKRRYRDDTIGIEDLGLSRVPLSALGSTPYGSENEVVTACQRTLRAANKGVAHFTEDRGERGQAEDALLCSKVTKWLIENYVYSRLEEELPTYREWTAG